MDKFKEFELLRKSTITWVLLNLEIISENEERTKKFKSACELSQYCLDDDEKQQLLKLLDQTAEYEIPSLIDYLSDLIRQ